MARIWKGVNDVDRSVDAIARIMVEQGALPPQLVAAYQGTLTASTRGLVQRFYERLATECPDALKYFASRGGDDS